MPSGLMWPLFARIQEDVMPTKIVIKKNTYFDSVSLMSVSTKANKLPGVEQAFVAMATEMNKGVLKNLGLLTPELEDAKNGDLMIVIKGEGRQRRHPGRHRSPVRP